MTEMNRKHTVLIFGGTTEGRELAQRAADMGFAVTVSVATPLGAEELREIGGIQVRTGRLDGEGMRALARSFRCCVDATHPYAVEASGNIARACGRAGVPLCRLVRGESRGRRDEIRVDSAREAAERLRDTRGNILLTTGSKELPVFAAYLPPERLFPRVLPVEESLAVCRRAHVPVKNIIAMHGPFSQRLNEAILEQYGIQYLVTKDGGEAGGFPEKARAAEHVGAALIVIKRPAETGLDLGETVVWLDRMARGCEV